MGHDDTGSPLDHEALALVLSAQQLARDIETWAARGEPLPDGHAQFLRTLLRDVSNARPKDLAQVLRLPASGDWPERSGPYLGAVFQSTRGQERDVAHFSQEQAAEALGVVREATIRSTNESVAERVEPVAERPEPVAERPEPVAERPESVAERPESVAERPESVAERVEKKRKKDKKRRKKDKKRREKK